jgi:hypothetical protein
MIEQLDLHFQNNPEPRIEDLFTSDPHRLDKYSIRLESGGHFLYFDFSKNILDDRTLEMLHALAEEKNVFSKIQDMFNGEKINATENRAVLHVALRNRSNRPIMVDGKGWIYLFNIYLFIIIITIVIYKPRCNGRCECSAGKDACIYSESKRRRMERIHW